MDSSSSSSSVTKPRANFSLTPHKISLCILLQVFSPPSHLSLPFPFSSISQHNSLAVFLLSHVKSFASPFEPSLSSLVSQLKLLSASLSDWLIDHLTNRLASFSSADDLFNFFIELRGILGGSDLGVIEDDCIALDPSSQLGLFVRRCCLSFNTLSLECIFHLVDAVSDYSKDEDSNYEGGFADYENMEMEGELEGYVFDKMRDRKDCVSFHLHTPGSMIQTVEEFGDVEASHVSLRSEMVQGEFGSGEQVYLHGNWQIQGYLAEQADTIEKQGSSFPFNEFENILDRIEKLAPELHRVKYLRYLNSLYHDDYPAAMENLMCYFDSTAGLEGMDSVAPASAGGVNFGRYEIALLCMGMMHFHFGHPKQALGVLTEAVRYSQQQSNDTCLAYILAAICNLLSEFGFSATSGILGSSYGPMGGSVTSFSVQQQLLVLLKSSLRRAENLNLKRLVTSNHLAMAKFELKHVQRPLLSFGPKASMQLRTCPVDACKELRLCSRLVCEYGSESSSMSVDGAFSTMWLKNLHKPAGSLVLSEENVPGQGPSAITFFSLPSSIPGSISQLVGSSYLLRATAWESYGSAPLARINALVYATCFSDTSSLTDLALTYSKFIMHLAVYNGYKDAFAALVIAEDKFPSISKSRIQIIKLQLLHERALHRGDLKLAQQVCDELGIMTSCVTGVDMDLKVEASLRHARTLLAANQFSQAADVAHSLFCMCYKFNMHVENATVLILLAEIQKRSGNAVLGIPYALAGLSFCQSFNLDLLKATATLTLAELWLSLGWSHAKRALTLLHGALPMILGHGGLELRARARIAEAKCYLSDPTFSISEDPDVVLEPLTEAAAELQVLEYHVLAAEAFYIKAIVSDKLGQLEEREEAAVLFKRHLMAQENPQKENDTLVETL